jgi:hypothetical protein
MDLFVQVFHHAVKRVRVIPVVFETLTFLHKELINQLYATILKIGKTEQVKLKVLYTLYNMNVDILVSNL